MIDPVDTDALREWTGEEPTWDDIDRGWTSEALNAIGGLCDEVDRLQAESEHLAGELSAVKSNRDQTIADFQQVRAVIENAPHALDCESRSHDFLGHEQEPGDCTCWKFTAL